MWQVKKKNVMISRFPFKKYFMGKALLAFMLPLALAGCSDDDNTVDRPGTPLHVSVGTAVTRAAIDGGQLPDGSRIGITLTDMQGAQYDGADTWFNVPYGASGTGDAQVWAAAGSRLSLSTTVGQARAYYPYNPDVTDLTAVPVETASQTDYMYSGAVTGLSLASYKASFVMRHVMTDIRLVIKKGTYTGNSQLKAVTVTSPFFGTAATLNTLDGTLSDITGTGAVLTAPVADGTQLTAEGVQYDLLTVADPSVTAGTLEILLEVGEDKYVAAVDVAEAFANGQAYQYTLTLDNTGLSVVKAVVEGWNQAEEQYVYPDGGGADE